MPKLMRSASLTDYPEVARSVGLDPYRMLAKAGLPRSCLKGPDVKISAAAVERLLEASARAAAIEDFGLRLARRRSLSNLGPLALIVREQPTVRKAIEVLIQYIGLHSEALSPQLKEEDGVVTISRRAIPGQPLPKRQALELSMGVLYRILKAFLGGAWRPESVCFMHRKPKNPELHRRFFDSCVRFGCDFDGLECRAQDLETPIPTADPAMARYLKQYLDSIAPAADASLSEKVQELTRAMLRSGNCSAARIAGHLGVDRRTLHRWLAVEGESYKSLLDAVRSEAAKRSL